MKKNKVCSWTAFCSKTNPKEEISSLRHLKILPRTFNEILLSWIWPQYKNLSCYLYNITMCITTTSNRNYVFDLRTRNVSFTSAEMIAVYTFVPWLFVFYSGLFSSSCLLLICKPEKTKYNSVKYYTYSINKSKSCYTIPLIYLMRNGWAGICPLVVKRLTCQEKMFFTNNIKEILQYTITVIVHLMH